MSFSGPLTALPQVHAGRIRALGVSSIKRLATAPDIPTIAEAGVPGYELVGWFGLFVPAATPRSVIARLNAEAVKVLNQPEVKKRLTSSGTEVVGSSPQEMEQFVARDIALNAKIINGAGIKPE